MINPMKYGLITSVNLHKQCIIILFFHQIKVDIFTPLLIHIKIITHDGSQRVERFELEPFCRADVLSVFFKTK